MAQDVQIGEIRRMTLLMEGVRVDVEWVEGDVWRITKSPDSDRSVMVVVKPGEVIFRTDQPHVEEEVAV